LRPLCYLTAPLGRTKPSGVSLSQRNAAKYPAMGRSIPYKILTAIKSLGFASLTGTKSYAFRSRIDVCTRIVTPCWEYRSWIRLISWFFSQAYSRYPGNCLPVFQLAKVVPSKLKEITLSVHSNVFRSENSRKDRLWFAEAKSSARFIHCLSSVTQFQVPNRRPLYRSFACSFLILTRASPPIGS
jgi:hypothetical protein